MVNMMDSPPILSPSSKNSEKWWIIVTDENFVDLISVFRTLLSESRFSRWCPSISAKMKPISRLTIKFKNMSIKIFHEFKIAKLTTKVRWIPVQVHTRDQWTEKFVRTGQAKFLEKRTGKNFLISNSSNLHTMHYVCIWCWLEHKKTESAVQTSVNFRANVISATFK